MSVILEACASLAVAEVPPLAHAGLALLAEAAQVVRHLALVKDVAQIGTHARVEPDPLARRACLARALLRGFGTIGTDDNAITIGSNGLQAAIISTIHDGVRFFEKTRGQRYGSVPEADRTLLGSHLAVFVAQYANRAVRASDLHPAMAKVGDDWRWEPAEREHAEMRANPRAEPRTKAMVFFILLRRLDLEPASIQALHQCVKVHLPLLLPERGSSYVPESGA